MENLKQMRDAVRFRLGITLPIDQSVAGGYGSAPVTQPWPADPSINYALREAIRYVASKLDLSLPATPVGIPIMAQTVSGPFILDLQGSLMQRAGFDGLETIQSAWWRQSGADYDLKTSSFEEEDANRRSWTDVEPGTPDRFWIAGTVLYLVPAPSSAGTLHCVGRMGTLFPVSDQDTLRGIPQSYQNLIYDEAARMLCGLRLNVPQYASLHGLYASKVQERLKDLAEQAGEQESGDVPRLTYISFARAGRRRA